MGTGSQRRLLLGEVKSRPCFLHLIKMLASLESAVIMALLVSLRDVGSTRHANIQPSSVAVIHKLISCLFWETDIFFQHL